MNLITTKELLNRIRAGGESPAREQIATRYFSQGAPRKLRSLAKHLPGTALRVLDLGAGYGVCLAHFGERSVGVDRDAARVDFMRSLGLCAEIRDVENPNWSRDLGEFDVIWICDLLPHLRDPQALLQSLPALLGSNGRVVISDWVWPESAMLSWMARQLPGAATTEFHPEHLHRLSERVVQEWLSSAGLELESSWVHSLRPEWLGVCVKPFWPPRTLVARALVAPFLRNDPTV